MGILTGISYVSGLDYYKGVNEEYAKIVGKKHLMPPNPLLIMVSVDCDIYAKHLVANEWAAVYQHLLAGVSRLVGAGCDYLVIASNTGHMCVPTVRSAFPKLRILHIADCTAAAIKKKGLKKIGLLGTEPTMRESYLKDQLAKHGLEIIAPDKDEDLTQIFKFIMDELGFNIFKPTTLEFFKAQVRKLQARGCEGVILGCTEIELLIKQKDTPDVPLFASAELHISVAAEVQAGETTVEDIMPECDRAALQ
jgi:aspartate racemase